MAGRKDLQKTNAFLTDASALGSAAPWRAAEFYSLPHALHQLVLSTSSCASSAAVLCQMLRSTSCCASPAAALHQLLLSTSCCAPPATALHQLLRSTSCCAPPTSAAAFHQLRRSADCGREGPGPATPRSLPGCVSAYAARNSFGPASRSSPTREVTLPELGPACMQAATGLGSIKP